MQPLDLRASNELSDSNSACSSPSSRCSPRLYADAKAAGSWRSHYLAFPVLLVVISLAAGCAKKKTPIGSNPPVTPERLSGYRLTDIKHQLSWRFDETAVVIDNNQQPIYEYLFEDLGLEVRKDAKRIEAKWLLDETGGALILSELKIDGTSIRAKATVPIRPAGPIRVNLGSRQYNMFRRDSERDSMGAENGKSESQGPLTRADLEVELKRHKSTSAWRFDASSNAELVGTWHSDDADRLPLVFTADGGFQCGFLWRNGEGRLAKGLYAINDDGRVVAVATDGDARLGVFYHLESDGLLYGSRGPKPRVAWKKASNQHDLPVEEPKTN